MYVYRNYNALQSGLGLHAKLHAAITQVDGMEIVLELDILDVKFGRTFGCIFLREIGMDNQCLFVCFW